MAKESLIEMGLTEEQAVKVMDGLNGDFVPKPRFNEVNADMKNTRAVVAERDKQLEALLQIYNKQRETKDTDKSAVQPGEYIVKGGREGVRGCSRARCIRTQYSTADPADKVRQYQQAVSNNNRT